MGIRTGEELLESLRDDRQLFIDGERVRDVTADPRFAEAARSLAALYDMQHDAALTERMTFRSPTSGERVGLSFIEPRSVDDLIRRRDMVKIWMDASCGMFGRSPDFMNIIADRLCLGGRGVRPQGQALRREPARLSRLHPRERHLHDPHPGQPAGRPLEARRAAGQGPRREDRQGNRCRDRHQRRAHGLDPVRLCRTISWCCRRPILPPARRPSPTPSASASRSTTPGLRFICRPSVIHQNAASPMDYPLSSRFDETDAMVIFDDVLVPWERVFIHRDAELCNGLYNRAGIMPQIMHQFSTKNLAKSEFMMGLGFAIAQDRPISISICTSRACSPS